MNILIICNYSSGLLKFRELLIKELMNKGHNISAIIPYSNDSTELKSEKALENSGVNLIRISMERRGMNPLKDFCLFRSYKKILKSQKPDFVITYTIKPNAYGGIACRIMKVPYAVNITGLGTAFQSDGLLKKFVTTLYKIAFKKARVVFFENEENLNTVVNYGIIPKDKCCLLNGAGVDLNEFEFCEYPQETDEVKFLFMGRVMKEKGVDELFSAMRLLKNDGINCTLEVLGGYEENYAYEIDKCAAEGWLVYHGYQFDVKPFIRSIDCFVLPSHHEGMANTNLECSSMGRPVITSNIHGCLEAVEDGKTGYLCEVNDADSLYKAMKKFALLPYSEKAQMGMNARKRMENIFDKKKVVEETINHLKLG